MFVCGGGGDVFQMEGASFLSGGEGGMWGSPWVGISFSGGGGGIQKKLLDGGGGDPPCPPTMGNPDTGDA